MKRSNDSKRGRIRRAARPVSGRAGKTAKIDRLIEDCWTRFRKGRPAAPRRSVVIALTEAGMQLIWTEHLARWCYYYDPATLEQISRRLVRARRLTGRQREYLRNLKNIGDDLRSFFQLFAVNHRVPRLVQRLVKLVGQIRDQVRLKEFQRAGKRARQLVKLVTRSRRIHWPELAIDPARGRDFLCARMDEMKRLLDRPQLTAHEFHRIKKHLRSVYTVYFCLYPGEARLSPRRNALAAIKKLVKRTHQVLLEEKYRRGLKYRATRLTLPDEFRTYVLKAVGKVKITHRADGVG